MNFAKIGYNAVVGPAIALLPSKYSAAVFDHLPPSIEPRGGLEAAVHHTFYSGMIEAAASGFGPLIGSMTGNPEAGFVALGIGFADGATRMLASLGYNDANGRPQPSGAGILEGAARMAVAFYKVATTKSTQT